MDFRLLSSIAGVVLLFTVHADYLAAAGCPSASSNPPAYIYLLSDPDQQLTILMEWDIGSGQIRELGRDSSPSRNTWYSFVSAIDPNGRRFFTSAILFPSDAIASYALTDGSLDLLPYGLASGRAPALSLDWDPATQRLYTLVREAGRTWLGTIEATGPEPIGPFFYNGEIRQDDTGLDEVGRVLWGFNNVSNNEVATFNLETGEAQTRFSLDLPLGAVRCLEFDGRNDRLIIAADNEADGTDIYLADPTTGSLSGPLATLDAIQFIPSSCSIDPSGTYLVAMPWVSQELIAVDLAAGTTLARSLVAELPRLFIAGDFGPASPCNLAETIASLRAFLEADSGLANGPKRSFQAKLEAAERSYARCLTHTACNQLGAFIHEVDALDRAGRIVPSVAQRLRTGAWDAQAKLANCSCEARTRPSPAKLGGGGSHRSIPAPGRASSGRLLPR